MTYTFKPDEEITIEEILCYFCNKDLSQHVSFHNRKKESMKDDEVKIFRNMPDGVSCHAECYIHECVRVSFEEILKGKRDKGKDGME